MRQNSFVLKSFFALGALSIMLMSCNQALTVNEPIDNSYTKEWKEIKQERELSLRIPKEWKKLDYSDTIKNTTSYRMYHNNDSGFFQLSVIDSIRSRRVDHIINLFNNIIGQDNVSGDSLYVEEIVLSGNVQVINYSSFRLEINGKEKRCLLITIPYQQGLMELFLAIPRYWNTESNKYLLSQIALTMKHGEANILDRHSEIQKLNKLYY